MNMNYIQEEPGLMEPVKSEPAFSEKKEVVEDGWRDIAELQCVQGTSTSAIVCSTNVDDSIGDLDNILNIKEDLGSMDIGPTVLQHMDAWYTTNQTQVSGECVDVCELKIDPILCGGVQEEIIKDERRVQTGDGLVLPASSPTPRDSLMEQLGTFTVLNSLHKECLETVRTVQLWRPDTFQCDVCDAVYIDAHQLFQHVQEVHGHGPRRSLHQHVKSSQISKEGQRCATGSHPQLYRCGQCLKTYYSVRSLDFHRLCAHGNESHKCAKCGKEFKSKNYLRRHVLYVHTEERHVCAVCMTICKSEGALKSHVQRAHESVGSHPQLYRCSQCPKTCNSVRSLNFHRLCAHGNESHKCAKCGKEFKSENYLRRHVLYVHAEERHECAVCMTICKSEGALKNHVRRAHKSRQAKSPVVYICVYCHKTYMAKHSLISHIEGVHTKVHYRCSQCSKEYKGKGSLQRHMRMVHSKEGSVIYICDYCKKMFSDKRGLQKHIAHVHTSGHYDCHQCNKIFKCKDYLISHTTRVHTADSQLCACTNCGKNFKSKWRCQQHEKRSKCARPTASSTSAAASTSRQQRNVVIVKEEPADGELELGPTVFQHMDCNYRPYKPEPQLD